MSKRMSAKLFHETGAKKPSSDGFWMGSEATDLHVRTHMEEGSAKLLHSLWRSHPRILMTLGANGNQVIMP